MVGREGPPVLLSLQSRNFNRWMCDRFEIRRNQTVIESEHMLGQPRDFIGNILAVLISRPLRKPDFRAQVMRWRMVVVLETDYYPVTIRFDKGVKVGYGDNPQPTIRVKASLDTIIKLVKGATSPIRALLTGGLKVKGLLRHPRATLQFYRLISSSIRG